MHNGVTTGFEVSTNDNVEKGHFGDMSDIRIVTVQHGFGNDTI